MADVSGLRYEKASPEKLILDKRQDFFWRDLNHWFSLMDACQHIEASQQAGAQLYSDMAQAWQSRNNAFRIVDDGRKGLDTKNYPRGIETRATVENAPIEIQKAYAITWIKATGKFKNHADVIHQAALKNDAYFLRATLPNALKKDRKYDACVVGAPKSDLAELLATMWCGNWFRPNWMPQDLPPLCVFSDKAIADLLYLLFPDRKKTFDGKAVEAMRRRLKLIKIQRRNFKQFISTATQNSSARLVFNSDI